MSRVAHDRHAFGQRGGGTMVALRSARLYLLEAQDDLSRADDVNGQNSGEVASFLAGETLADGWDAELGGSTVTWPVVSDVYGNWPVTWHTSGPYDEYCPDDPVNPLRRWQAPASNNVVAPGNLGAAYELDVRGYSDVLLFGTLNANCALTFDNLSVGSRVTIAVTQDATGGRTLTVNGQAVAVDSTPASVTVLRAYSPDGTVVYVDAPGVDPAIVGASIKRTTAQSVANGGTPLISFDTEVWDTHGFANLGSAPTKITIPTGKGGFYALEAQVAWAANNTGGRYAAFWKNGFGVIASARKTARAETGTTIHFEAPLAAGDYVELLVSQDSGGALNAIPSGFDPGIILQARRLGPSPV